MQQPTYYDVKRNLSDKAALEYDRYLREHNIRIKSLISVAKGYT